MSDGKDQFDRWIDEGVQRYVAAEPPLGMEGRVLARLEPQRRRWWRPWMITVPVAALLALVIGLAVQNNAGTPPKPVVGWSEKGSGPAKPAVATVSNPPAVTARIPHP